MTRIKQHNVEEQMPKTMTVEELLNSGLVGIWKNRTDIDNNLDFARELRDRSWARKDTDNDPR
ncbi:MAG: hypothetical protein WA705_12480 [Candidatus Ozemobacteraceae bacterium]